MLAFVRAACDGERRRVPCCASPTCPGSPSRSSSTCATSPARCPVEVFGQNRFAPDRRPAVLADAGAVRVLLVRARRRPGDRRRDRRRRRAARAGRLVADVAAPAGRRSAARSAAGCPSRRWFAGKGATVRDVVVDDVVALDDRRDVALVIVRTSFTEGDDHRVRRAAAAPSTSRGARGRRRCARRADRPARRRRRSSMPWRRRRAPASSPALRCVGARGAAAAPSPSATRGAPGLTKLADDPRDVHLLGVEQSNSSVHRSAAG